MNFLYESILNDPLLADFSLIYGVIFSLLCGFIIGVERQIHGKPVGIRTSILICLGTMLFIVLGNKILNTNDSTRILGQIITGVGFLGAGVIMNKEGLVSGVTSASIVWLLAGIGAAIGFNYYLTAIAISLLALFILIGVQKLENVFKSLQKGVHRHKKDD